MEYIKDLWIMKETGIVIFSHESKKNIDPQLFGGLMSAINSFAESLVKGGLESFEIGNARFTLIKRDIAIFIGASNIESKKKKVNKELEQLADDFIDLYAEELQNFTGAVNIFSSFEKELENATRSSLGKLKQAFW
ncbi:MAG: hypothetical protein ACOC44_14040 [Promethearchaeia archaeon]